MSFTTIYMQYGGSKYKVELYIYKKLVTVSSFYYLIGSPSYIV